MAARDEKVRVDGLVRDCALLMERPYPLNIFCQIGDDPYPLFDNYGLGDIIFDSTQ